MKKRIVVKNALLFAIFLLVCTNIFAMDTPDLFLNGELKDVQMVLKNSTTLVPLRFCSEELQATVNWKEATQEITIIKGNANVQFTIGSTEYSHNGERKKLLVVPELINGTTYIPFRPLIEALNGVVLYNNENKFINIYDRESEAYEVYKSINSDNVIKKRFAMLESPRISHIPDIEATMHEYIFPLENPNANYFLEYQGTWEKEPIISLKYYTIIDGVAVNTWGRQVKQNYSFPIDIHPLFKLVGDAKQENKIEVGSWPNPIDLNYVMFLQDTSATAVFYLNNIWTDFSALTPDEIGTRVINPFSNKDIVLFNIDNKSLLEKYGSDTH